MKFSKMYGIYKAVGFFDRMELDRSSDFTVLFYISNGLK